MTIKRKKIFWAGIALFVIAAFLLLYPAVSNLINEATNKSTIQTYNNNVKTFSDSEKEGYLSEAKKYNDSLLLANENYVGKDYKDILNFNKGQIGTIEIPDIKVNLPIYHGINEKILVKGAAHLEKTSFPIGGESTHSVISAHTAYPGKVFFDNISKLEKGDYFYVNVLDEKLAYRVCDINITDPNDTKILQIQKGRDLVSLMTCYPYAINTHRLVVTGERVTLADTPDEIKVDSVQSDSNKISFWGIFIPCVVFLVAVGVIRIFVKKNNHRLKK